MAARPIERYVKRQIMDQGGWPRILERIAAGETVADVARTIFRPDGQPISRPMLSNMLHADPERSKQAYAARDQGSDAMVDQGLHLVDSAQPDRDSLQKAKTQAELRLKVAGFISRERWGETKQQTNVQINVESMHLDALRHRTIEASRPLAAALEASAPGIALDVSHACETENGQSVVSDSNTVQTPQLTEDVIIRSAVDQPNK